ncbi:MAG: hypothetical protein BZ137_02490, partial [Methanosphaera sp. rholeuAM130]
NSNNNLIDTQKAFTTNIYSVELINSSNNNITNNNFNASNINGGDAAIKMDENSVDNYLNNNTPNFGLLTDDTYSVLFDENGVYKFPAGVDILTLAGDLYNKDLIFTNNLTFVNGGDYTIYNGTIILNDVEGRNYTDRFVNIKNINVDNKGKPALIDNLTIYRQRNVQVTGGQYFVEGDGISAFESVSDISLYTILDVSNVTVLMGGNDVTAFKMIRDVYSRNDYLYIRDCNISIISDGKGTAFEVVNTNLDMLRSNIVQVSDEVVTLYAKDVYANGQFFMNNNITVLGENIALITLKDNHGSNPSFGNNTIRVTSENPVSVFNVTNASNTYIGQGQSTSSYYYTPNTIMVDAENGEVPLIYVDAKGYVRNNYILASDVFGDAAVSAQTVSNNTPYVTNIIIAPDVLYKGGDNVITANAVGSDKKAVEGTFTFYVNGEEAYTADGTTASFTYKPTTTADVEVTVEFTTDLLNYADNVNTSIISVVVGDAVITMDDFTANAGETVTLTANVKDVFGDAVTSGKVTFKVNGKTVKDANGKVIYAKVIDGVASVEYAVPEDFAGQNFTVTAVYTGSANVAKTQNTSTLTVNNPEASIEFENEPVTASVGQTVTFTVKVTGDATKVVFKVNGKSLKDANGKVIYAQVVDGIATIEYTIPENMKAKDYTLTAVAMGSERLTTEQTLTISE